MRESEPTEERNNRTNNFREQGRAERPEPTTPSIHPVDLVAELIPRSRLAMCHPELSGMEVLAMTMELAVNHAHHEPLSVVWDRVSQLWPRTRAEHAVFFMCVHDMVSGLKELSPTETLIVNGVGRWHAQREQSAILREALTSLPHPTSTPEKPFIDLLSGIGAARLIPVLRGEGAYFFIDRSPFVTAYLSEAALQGGPSGARALKRTVDDFSFGACSDRKAPGSGAKFSTIRLKNPFAYLPQTFPLLSKAIDSVSPGGQVLLQVEAAPHYSMPFLRRVLPFVAFLESNGWEIALSSSSRSCSESQHLHGSLIGLHLIRPGGTTWKGWMDETNSVKSNDLHQHFSALSGV